MEQDVEDFLAHHGVKGMRWGQRKIRQHQQRKANKQKLSAARQARADASFEKTRKKLRPGGGKQLTRAQDIQRARDRIDTGALKADQKAAKAKFKKEKVTLGRKEARRLFRGRKGALHADIARSQEVKSGHEAAQLLIANLQRQLAAERLARSFDR